MRHGSSNRRRSNRGGGSRKNSNQKTQVFDSNGPDVRIRGTAHQVAEKYVALAKDAQGAGDTVMYQNYLQHAEHYQRLINTWEEDNAKKNFEISDADFDKDEKGATEESKKVASKQKEDDLGLPASILGGEASVESKSKDVEMEAS